jgi:phosphoglucosamine mutase
VGRDLTPELIERLGRAISLWAGGGDLFIGRDTRGSGPELQRALISGITSVGGHALVAGVLPTPAVALLADGAIGAVVSASHNPPQYNGVKLFDREGQKLVDAAEEEIESLLDAAAGGPGRCDEVELCSERYVAHVLDRFGSDLTGLRIAVDCANGAYSEIAPAVFARLGARVTAVAAAPDGTNINVGCGATDLSQLQRTVRAGDFDLGVAFDGDGDRMLAVDGRGEAVDGDGIVAILALHLGVDMVAVTTMTNHGFHRLMADHGIRVVTTDVGDRYVLEALRREGAVLGGEQSGHIVYLRDHVTGDGLVAALMLCRALEGRTLAAAAAVLCRLPQAKENVAVARKELSVEILAEVARVNGELAPGGRVLVRASGTEPVVRVLVEAAPVAKAREVCDTIAALVRWELG